MEHYGVHIYVKESCISHEYVLLTQCATHIPYYTVFLDGVSWETSAPI